MEIRLLEEAYGFKIKSYEKIKNICRTETDKGIKCIKKAHMSPAFFHFLYSAVKHLKNNGFEGVMPYNDTIDGRICLQDDKYIYYVVDWIESRECKFKRQNELNMAIKTAAELHKAAIGYKPPQGAKPRVYYNRWIDKFNAKCIELLAFSKAIEEKASIDEFDEIYAKDLPYFWNQARESIELLKRSPYGEISEESRNKGEFCHHDMANHNFLITPEDKVYLIDFDYCIMDTRLHDLCSLIIRNMRYGVWNISKAYMIIEEYSRHYTVTDKELRVMKAFITFPQDFWQVGLQYYVEKQPWTMDYFLMRLTRVVDDKLMRQSFLDEFLLL
ncbi:MAG: CotS family spore coat protein [Bacillota bacterium]